MSILKVTPKQPFTAVQWTGENKEDVESFCGNEMSPTENNGEDIHIIYADCGMLFLEKRDYIVKNTYNTFLTFQEDEFNKLFSVYLPNRASEETFQKWRKESKFENMTRNEQEFTRFILSDSVRNEMIQVGGFNKIFESARKWLKTG